MAEGTAAALAPPGLDPAAPVGNGDGALAGARNLFGIKPFVAAKIKAKHVASHQAASKFLYGYTNLTNAWILADPNI